MSYFTEDSIEKFPKPLPGIVDEEIGLLPGRLKFRASYWPAMLDDEASDRNLTLQPGQPVLVVGRVNITLLVRPVV